MKLRRSVLLGTWSVVAANLILAFAAIGLLVRMSPAIATILERNDVSLAAAEEMLAVLAVPAAADGEAAREERFRAALARAERNITEPEERDVLAAVRADLEPALAGEPEAVAREVAVLRRLAGINRHAMREADDAAMAMGTGGAWAVVMLALVSFAISLVFVRQLIVRLLEPIEELQQTLAAARRGDVHRRATFPAAPPDLAAMLADTNALLDRLQAAHPRDLDRDGPRVKTNGGRALP